jgi:CDP-diacylglycerol--glycerol-3-phosphate 3-phosphatidyltransferase
MISVYHLKPKFQALLMPILKYLYKHGITANMITILSILLSLATGIYLFIFPGYWALIIMPLALLLRMALNALDGMMARNYQMQSKKGEVLNEVGDVFSDFVMFYPLGVLFMLKPLLLVFFLMLSILNEFAGILGKAISGVRRYEGPMGKSDRALVVGLSCIFLSIFAEQKWIMNYVFVVVVLLLLLSTFIRMKKSIKLE